MADDQKFPNVLNMSGLGDRLREAREKKGLTMGQAQKQTHIQSNVLKSLEDGSCDTSLSPTYTKSFLKKYSEYLGLDPARVLNEYKRLHPKTEIAADTKVTEHGSPSEGITNMIPVIRLLVAVAIAIAIIAVIGGKVISGFKKKHKISARVTVSKAQASVARAKSTQKPSSKVPASSARKGAEVSIPKNVKLKLLIKVNQNVLVKIRSDGVLLSDHVLTKGTAEVFTADNLISIFTANGEYIELVLNGKPMGSPGKGLLKNIEVTRSGIKIK